jgi:hypothetical protein
MFRGGGSFQDRCMLIDLWGCKCNAGFRAIHGDCAHKIGHFILPKGSLNGSPNTE